MHGGILYGFDSLLTLFPEAETGVYVAINGPMGDTAQIAVLVLNQYISDLMLGLPPWLNQSTLCSYPFPWKKREEYIPKTFHIPIDKTLKSHRSLTVYKGKYVSKALGTLTINEKTENGNSFCVEHTQDSHGIFKPVVLYLTLCRGGLILLCSVKTNPK